MWRRALLLTALALTGCQEPRVPPTSRAEALRDREPREVKVVKIWDQVSSRLEAGRDPQVSHYLEVDVLSGPDQGAQRTFPYDQWNTGRPPPDVGDRLLMSPADWVARDPRTQGRTYGR